MIAYNHEQNETTWQQNFVAMLPEVEQKLRLAFCRLDSEAREDAIEEGIVHSLLSYVRLDEQGRREVGYERHTTENASGKRCASTRRGTAGGHGQGCVSARPGWAGGHGQGCVSARPGWAGENNIDFTIPSVDGSADHPVAIINHIDQQSCQIQASELGGNLVFREGGHERIKKIPS